ncbi:MAG: inverse autotransporter beta domain-containing protein [Chlamydiota bacterium]
MRIKFISKLLLLLAIVSLHADQNSLQPLDCGDYTFSRIGIQHLEHKGMGFNQGYSTVSLFAAPLTQTLPFIDGRLHVFNSGELAANGGFGLRYSNKKETFLIGFNTYYDYRHHENLTTQQISGGIEFLSRRFDFRLNGYYPFYEKYKVKLNPFTNRQTLRYALASADTSLGITLPAPCDEIGLYLELGYYYLFDQRAYYGNSNFNTKGSSSIGSSSGGRARLNCNPTDYIGFGVEYTFDHLFGSRFNGFLAFNIPLGPKKLLHSTKNRYPYEKSPCDLHYEWKKIQTQSVLRNPIIPMITKRKSV